MDRQLRQLQRRVQAGDLSAKARLRHNILRSAPAGVGSFLVLDANRDTGFIKQARVTGVWKVQGMRIEDTDMSLRMLLRRVEGGELAPDDFASEKPRNTIWLSQSRVSACLVRVGDPELAVGCPHCHAAVGAFCRRPSGRLHGAAHVARAEALALLLVPSTRPVGAERPPVDPVALAALRERMAGRGFETTTRLGDQVPEEDAA